MLTLTLTRLLTRIRLIATLPFLIPRLTCTAAWGLVSTADTTGDMTTTTVAAIAATTVVAVMDTAEDILCHRA